MCAVRCREQTTFGQTRVPDGRDFETSGCRGRTGRRTNVEVFDFSGATRRDRTGDLLITNQPLYQLS